MKNEKIKEFLTKLTQEEGFKVEFLKLKEKVEKKGFSKKDNEKFISECLLPWSKKLGYELTKKDFIDFDRTQKPTEITGLSPTELKNVSGGGLMLWSLFAMFGSALAGLAGGGGSTGNNANTNSGSFSSSLVEYSPTGIASQDYYDYHYGTTPADFVSGAAEGAGTTISESSQQTQPTPAGDTYSPINPSTWQDVPEQIGLNQNMFSPSGTPLITTPDTGSDEQAPGLFSRIGATIGKGLVWAGNALNDYAEDYMNNYGETSVEEHNRLYGEPSARVSGQNYGGTTDGPSASAVDESEPPLGAGAAPVDFVSGAVDGTGATISASSQQEQTTPADDTSSPITPSTWQEVPEQSCGSAEKPMSTALVTTPGQPQASVGDSGQNYARSSPRPSVFPQPRLAGNVGQYGKNIGDASSTSNGGQETINMLSDIHSAENANFKLFETQTNQNESHIGTALVSTSEQASGSLANPVSAEELSANSTFTGPASSVTAGGIRWHLNTQGGTVFERDISSEDNGAVVQQTTTTNGFTTGPVTSTVPESAASSTGSAPLGLLGYEQSSGGFGAAESAGTTRPTAPKGPTGIASYDNYLVGAGEIPSGTGTTPVDFGISTVAGNAGGDGGQSVLSQAPQTHNSTPVGAPMFTKTNTTQGKATLNATQNNTDSNATQGRSSFTSNDGPKLKDDLKKFATGMAVGLTTMTGIAGALAAGSSGDESQQNASKTKETTAKTEDKKSTKEAKKESDFMHLFMENLQKNSPEASQYLNSRNK